MFTSKSKFFKLFMYFHRVTILNCFRTKDGNYTGMFGEVYHGIVDTSVAGFSTSPERSEVMDFTHAVFKSYGEIWIKRPLKTDASFRYFTLGEKDIMKLTF